MGEVRAGVDRLDLALVELLAERFRYMAAAARIKPERGQVRDEPRKAEVIAQAEARARELGLPAGIVAAMWDLLVEGSIAYEMERFDALRQA
jgi:isochorismate pyruvate lyase